MKIVPYKATWLTISTLMLAASFAAIGFFGFRFSADFTEGTLVALQFARSTEAPAEGTEGEKFATQQELRESIEAYQPPNDGEKITGIDLKSSGSGQFSLRMKRLTEEEQQALFDHLRTDLGAFEVLQTRDVSPIFAQAFRNKALSAIAVASVMIILYITFAFRKVSRGIRSWKLGVAAVVALLHDLIIMLGVFAILGHYAAAEIDALFITAMLSIMGFSVHNTIVVFDRIRENILHKHYQETFDQVAERSVQQTFARSINTSLTAALVLLPLLFFGAAEIYYFVLALLVGIVFGTYTSIYVATPLLTYFQGSESQK